MIGVQQVMWKIQFKRHWILHAMISTNVPWEPILVLMTPHVSIPEENINAKVIQERDQIMTIKSWSHNLWDELRRGHLARKIFLSSVKRF